MAKYLPLPNGDSLKVPDEMGYEEAMALARQRFPQLFPGEAPAQRGGLGGAFGRGLESLLSTYQTAAGAITAPEEAARQALARQELLSQKYAEPTSLERVKKAYEDKGVLAAAREVVSQVPGAVTEQLPQMATVFGAARLGATAGSLAGPVGTVAGGIAGTAAALLPQFIGSNIQRQAAEQTARGEPISIDRGAAVATAVPQAAVEGAAYALTFGGRLVSKLTGIPEKALMVGQRDAKKLAEERLLATLGKGTLRGAAVEIPTEIAQQMMERAQAGLPLTSPDALAEYGQTAYQVGLLAPLGAVGRVSERGGARQQVEAEKRETARQTAEAEEAARSTPEALSQLYENYQTLSQQKTDFDNRLKAAAPRKGSTDAEKQAFQDLKAQRTEFLNTQFKPVEQEYNKRRGAIEQMMAQRQMELETAAAPGQAAATRALPSDIPGAQPFQLAPVPRLMGTYGDLRRQLDTIETELSSGPDIARQRVLEQQREQLNAQITELGTAIEQQGGTTDTQEELNKKLKAAESERLKLLGQGDFDAAKKLADRIEELQLKLPMVQEAQLLRTQAGQTRELFGGVTPTKTPEQESAERQTQLDEADRELEVLNAEYEKAVRDKNVTKAQELDARISTVKRKREELLRTEPPVAKAETVIQPAQLQAVETAKAQADQAEQQLTQLARDKTVNREVLYKTIDDLNQAENALSRAKEDVGRPTLKPAVLDIFSPANIMQEALRRGDTKVLNDLARQTQRQTLQQSLDEKATERDRLITALEGRLDAPGVKRERADLFSEIYDQEAKTKFKNGTYPDKALQALYDKGGAAAVEYEWVLNKTKPLMAKVTTPQGNAKKSLYEQLVETAAEHSRLVDQMESGVATPTMREKTAQLQAKLGKGEAPAARQMDAGERAQLKRKIASLEKKFRLIEGKVAPIRDQILEVHNSLYKVTPLEKPSVEKEKRRAEAEAEGRAPKRMSRAAATAKRIAAGDVRREAEASEKMRDLALELGKQEPGYKSMLRAKKKQLDALIADVGADSPKVRDFRIQTRLKLDAKAADLGRQTPEYKATLKEQIAVVREALAQSKQEVPTKRTPQVTRRQTAAPKELRVAGSRMTPKEIEAAVKEANNFDGGTAYRLRESDAASTVDAAEAQKVIDGLKLPENVKFVYAPTAGKIPVKLLQKMAAEGVDPTEGMVQGAVFSDGTVLVVGDQHADITDLEKTIAHEIIGHYGVDTVIGIKRLNKFAQDTDVIALAEQIGGKDLVREVLQTVRANADLGRSEEIQKLQALREIIAHAEEARVTESFREKAGRFIKELVGMIRAGLRDMGFTSLPRLSTSDVFYMLKQSRKAFANKTIGPYKIDAETNLRDWFGKSQVTDENGKPAVVYHGTDAEDIDVFDPARMGASGHAALGRGFYAGDRGYATDFQGEATKAVIPLYARIETPLYFDDELFTPVGLPEADAANMAAFKKVFAADPALARSVFKFKDGRIHGIDASKKNAANFERAMDIAGVDGVIDKVAKAAAGPNKGRPGYHQVMVRSNYQFKHAEKNTGAYSRETPQIAFRLRREQTSSVVGREPGIVDKFLGNLLGLSGRVQYVDQYAALSAAIKKGMDAGLINSLEATNAEYLLRFGQQRSQFAGQFLLNGPVRLRLTKKGGVTESLFESTKGVSMVDVAEALNAAKLAESSVQEDMFTVYMAGERAKQVGWEKLNFEKPAEAKAEYDSIIAQLNANKEAKAAFENAKKLYQQYNAGLIDFLEQTGVLTSKRAAELKATTYVPYYRVNNNGEVQLMIDKETPVRISNIKDEPQLQQLVGGNEYIMPIFTSAAQNTFMITNLGLRNQTVKETGFLLQKLGIASRLSSGAGPKGDNVVRFKKNGEDYHVVIDTDLYGIPAELIVRGMEGIKTTLPAIVRMMGYPADILRKFVTRMPAYAVRQIIRDPLNAWLTTGTDAVPVLSSMKELASMVAGRSDAERKLMSTGAISSNVFSGDEQDISKFLQDMSAGKSMWAKTLAKLDAFALQGDAATRAVIYKDSLDKGMSEQEALLRTLESMNFSRRGLSPSMQSLSVLIPFFNAQIQGLDVVYRAFKGDMPYSEQLKIKEKLMARGALLALGTIAYAAMMEDDEAYKRAKPQERYSSWFVYVPGVSEPFRVPIPFELGFLFKALPEAVYNVAFGDDKASKALSGLGALLNQTQPLALPQAIKPLTEVVLGKSFYSGDIESMREKQQLATDRYRENTTEVAKLLGKVTGEAGVSPISIDYLIRGYFGGLGIAIVQLANPILAPDQKNLAEPSTKPSKLPLIGGLFQPVEGRGTLDEAYNRMLEVRQVKGTYNKLIEEGKRAEALEFAQNYSNDLAQASVSGRVQKQLGELAKQERFIKAHPTMTTEEKDQRLAQIDKIKIQIARQYLGLPR